MRNNADQFSRNTFSLQAPAAPEQIGSVRKTVAQHMRAWSFPEDDVYSVTLAVGEACSNAVCYGKGPNALSIIVSGALVAPGRLRIDIENQGNGFHPNLPELAKLPAPEEFSMHGRGFALMSALVDTVEVLSKGHNTVVRLTKHSSLSVK